MCVLPLRPRRLPLTVAEYLAFGQDPDGVRYELQERCLVMSPTSDCEHQRVVQELTFRLDDQVPDDLDVLFGINLDLQLVPSTGPGTVRAPDVVVFAQDALNRHGEPVTTHDVALVIEVASPHTRRLDRTIKCDEYADAGIPHYWVVDLGEPGDRPTLTAHHLAGAFGYAAASPVTGVCTATAPFRARIDLDALTGRPTVEG